MLESSLTLREYESAQLCDNAVGIKGAISFKEADLLELHQRKTGRKIFERSFRSIKATNWVGVISVGRRCIEVIPKIDTQSDQKVRENLLYMIARAGLVSLTDVDVARLVGTNKLLLAAYLELYVDNLAREWRRGPIGRYIRNEENRPFLKGKLLLSEQLRRNLVHQERFFTACDEFTFDNEVSRLLKAALLICLKQKFSTHVSQKARSLMLDFDEVKDVIIGVEDLKSIKVDRRHVRYEPLVTLAKDILSSVSPSRAFESNPVYSLMFDMNEVFEKFIVAEMQEAFRGDVCSVKSQVSGKSLLEEDGRKRFFLRPDIGIFEDSNCECLVDTKWKILDPSKPYNNVTQADMYQMYAYGKEYSAPTVILLYPQCAQLAEEVAEYTHIETNPTKRILIRTIDISQPLITNDAKQELRQKLKAIVLGSWMS